MNRLKGTRCYLCGAMDRVKDAGVGWRRNIRCVLKDMDIQWLDPTRKPIDLGLEDDESRQRRRRNKRLGDFDAVRAEMKPIRCTDLRMVDICDWVVVNLDLDIHACGTYEEIALANRQKKPILIHVEQGKHQAPDWLFGVLPHEFIFSTWTDLFDYVAKVADGYDDNRGRWYFFNWMGNNPVIQKDCEQPPTEPPVNWGGWYGDD